MAISDNDRQFSDNHTYTDEEGVVEPELCKAWESMLPAYPQWCFGGTDHRLEEMSGIYGSGTLYVFTVSRTSPEALSRYRELLKNNGFRPAGRHPTETKLYKISGDMSLCFDSNEPFPSGDGEMCVFFTEDQPEGGFFYVTPYLIEKRSTLMRAYRERRPISKKAFRRDRRREKRLFRRRCRKSARSFRRACRSQKRQLRNFRSEI